MGDWGEDESDEEESDDDNYEEEIEDMRLWKILSVLFIVATTTQNSTPNLFMIKV